MSKKRRRLTKIERLVVYDKFQGNCAYCGKRIKYKDMQIDHVVPLANGGEDCLQNMYPACRRCNHYKMTMSVEKFRKAIEEIPRKLFRDSYIYKVGCDYGITPIDCFKPITFHFEEIEND